MHHCADIKPPLEDWPREKRILWNLASCGRFLHFNHGGRGGQVPILIRLEKEGPKSQRELQEYFGVSSAALSETLSRLETEGLITRTPDPNDRRKLNIEITADGSDRATQTIQERNAFEHEVLSCLNTEETVQLDGILSKLVSHWRKELTPCKSEQNQS
ncbi:MAG: MarR family transcriptional regulator [Atopobiaceae bacterium]|nr:MarR family transcriptional regulator [Atopobiaceae bacterium]